VKLSKQGARDLRAIREFFRGERAITKSYEGGRERRAWAKGSGKLSPEARGFLDSYGFDPLFGRGAGFFTKGPHAIPQWGAAKYWPKCDECGMHAHENPWHGGHRFTCSRYIGTPVECGPKCMGYKCPNVHTMIRLS